MVLRKWALAAVLLLASRSPLLAAFNDIVTGARPQGMGGAFVAVADDANALYWNPAGLTQLRNAELTLMHANEADVSSGPTLLTDFVGFSNWPMQFGTIGIAVFQQGNNKVLQERTYLFSYALGVSHDTSLGLNMKYLTLDPAGRQVTANDPALVTQDTVSFDLAGLHAVTPFWKMGFLIRNVVGETGTVIRENLRRTYRVGSAYRFEDVLFLDDSVTWSMDLFTKEDIRDAPGAKILAATGLEYSFDERVSIRVGNERGHVTAGLGFGHPESGIFVDYAFADDAPGTTHRISATYRFGALPGEVHVVHHMDRSAPEARPERKETENSGQTNGRAKASPNRSARAPARPGELESEATGRTGTAQIGATRIYRSGQAKEFDKEVKEFLQK
ncbi:MAG: hypothetical protein HY815_01965 [Candidatus Riflebacteria bacterium]|nr:hypothetical protein [Candidatus Riflebacteria bacterium]